MDKMRNITKILVRNPEDPSTELVTMLKWILKKDGVCGLDSAAWSHDPLLGFGDRGKWTFRMQKVKGISSPADNSQGFNSKCVPWS